MKIRKISNYEYELVKEGKMLVPGKIFANAKLMEGIRKDNTLEQIKNVSMLPGILKYSMAMPDAHSGYGMCIGGVAGFDIEEGIISPGAIGFDINCGIRLLRTNLFFKDMKSDMKNKFIDGLFKAVPTGIGKGGKIKLSMKDLNEILENGSQWLIKKGYGNKNDLINTEEKGKVKASHKNVSDKAKKRGIEQLGSIGSGNHFLEIQVVEKIFDKKTAQGFGLKKDQIVIMIHCGSRGLGHQVATDYIRLMEEKYSWYDKQLVNAPINSELGKKYLSAMNAAANFAFANRQMITYLVRNEFERYFPKSKIEVLYDVCHNIAKFEKHVIDGKKKNILIMRKGATRSFPKKPILIPGSMGTSSYVLVGTKKAEDISFASTAHGAGRVESRTKAREKINPHKVIRSLEKKGILLKARSYKGIAEEAPEVYKNVDEVVEISDKIGIGKKVAKLKPIAVIKG